MSFNTCSNCGQPYRTYKNPVPTVDIIIELSGGIVLIERKNPPYGWALPGGFVEYGESLKNAAIREAKEETNLTISLRGQLGAYSNPNRDNRLHTISYVFIASGIGTPIGRDDAKRAKIFSTKEIPPMAFDHNKIIKDYLLYKRIHKK